MAEWRIGRGWTEAELKQRLGAAMERPLNFEATPAEMTLEQGWNRYYSESVIAREFPGDPDRAGFFQRAWAGMVSYEFSDPDTVVGHFDARAPLLGRTMLLEIKVWGLHYLSGVRVQAVRDDEEAGRSVFGFRYDTLEGHIECGSEWFLLTKDEATGEIRFRVDASWRPGEFPNWWSRTGFHFLAPHYQERWHRRAHGRLFLLAHYGSLTPPRPPAGRLAHAGPDVVFHYLYGKRVS